MISVVFLIGCLFQVNAQVIQTNRYEITLVDRIGADPPITTPLDKDGVLVHQRVSGKKTDQLVIVKLDTALKENWKGFIEIDKSLVLSKTLFAYETVFFLFRSSVYGDFNFNIISVNAKTGNYSRHLINNLIPFGPTEFHLYENAVLIGGYFTGRPVVLHYSFVTEQSRLLPGFFNEPGEIDNIVTYENGLCDIIVSLRNVQRKKVLWCRTYSPEGELIQTTVIEGENNIHLLSAKSFRMADNSQVVAGVFGYRSPEYSRGYFIATITDEGQYTINYYNFSDLPNFFTYMKPKREARVKERIAHRKEKKKKIRLQYRFLVHEIIPYNNQLILLSESFYPKYIYTNPYSSYGSYRYFTGPTFRGDRIFDGYRYTHASLIALDNQNKILWDNAFEINDVKVFNLVQFVKFYQNNDRLKMLYVNGNTLLSKIIREEEVIQPKTETLLRDLNQAGTIKEKENESTTLNYWYDPYFIVSGIQNVQYKGNRESGQKVFFISKVKFQ